VRIRLERYLPVKAQAVLIMLPMFLPGPCPGPVLCCSESNVAVDNLLGGLIAAGVPAVRLGRSEAVRGDLGQYMVKHEVGRCRLTESTPVLKAKRLWFYRLNLQYDETLSNFALKFSLRRCIEGQLRQAQAVCCTCAAAGGEMLESIQFGAVLLDEAGSTTSRSKLNLPLLLHASA